LRAVLGAESGHAASRPAATASAVRASTSSIGEKPGSSTGTSHRLCRQDPVRTGVPAGTGRTKGSYRRAWAGRVEKGAAGPSCGLELMGRAYAGVGVLEEISATDGGARID